MFSVSPEIFSVLSDASRWLFAFFALMLLVFALGWHRSDRKERRDRFRNLPGAGTVGELVVLSGSDLLPPDTWFPVPREGVLGSLRSCDLVVPCPGVRSQHLDFSWQDGTGLMIRPRVGCEVIVDGVPVSRRGSYTDTPMVHGSVLQVGSSVLRLQLFSALSHTNRTFVPPSPVSDQGAGVWMPPAQTPVQAPPAQIPPAAVQPWSAQPYRTAQQMMPEQPPYPQEPVPEQIPQAQPDGAVSGAPRRKRADRWKEDWSE
uniref:FHA domain-containing protein n=1 Tax=uncultured bacterium Contigcl_1792 TaxID=1393663 RepID=W0FSY3_9BACT|nr:hypothetical protein [uncultured bacterium Contigcl_1792]